MLTLSLCEHRAALSLLHRHYSKVKCVLVHVFAAGRAGNDWAVSRKKYIDIFTNEI